MPFTLPQASRPLRIVVVEDEAIVAFEMEAHLTQAGHQVVGVADTPGEAIQLIEATRPDLVLLDVQLGGGSDGLEVARALRARGIACLFSTGNCPGAARDDAVGCLHKPYSRWQLVDAVAAADAIARSEAPGRVPNEMHVYR